MATVISHLTASQGSKAALNKQLENYSFNNLSSFQPPLNHKPLSSENEDRVNAIRKAHHLSELSVTDDQGSRMVYGMPVYNIKQEEYSFAMGNNYSVVNQNQVPVEYSGNKVNHNKGIDHYFHKETKPAYASSFLLTSVLSPDYTDKTGDGITDDDLGTAIKFNYSKSPFYYKWRTPYDHATLNRSLLADPDDDKASIVYGEKELRYIHSIESKTKIAYFITEDRHDGLGVKDWKGGIDKTNKQRCLKEIRLYSKADLVKPIKIVKFEYSYELCQGVPNVDSLATPDGQSGKLTLKKVYFQYANTDKGKHHPYLFSYNKTAGGEEPQYTNMATDRWGIFKKPAISIDSLKNEEFPYTNQYDKNYVDGNASLWHLNKIELPTGGIINVTYESDDYAFVQNKRAMVMSKGIVLINGARQPVSSLIEAKGLKIYIGENTPAGQQSTSWFKNTYLNGSDYLYSKINVKISTNNSSSKGADADFVSSYNKVKSVTTANGYAYVLFEDVNEANLAINPMLLSAWQKLKIEYPRYAYPGFDRRVKDNNAAQAVKSAVSAIVNAAKNLSELSENFYQKANRKNYASEVNLNKSFVRLVKTDGKKLGGGVRVKKVQISDNWASMSSANNVAAGTYGQYYSYTTQLNGKEISSGVASYEPAVGNDENPLKQPVPYVQKVKGSINSFFSLEEPFGESFFPGPLVGYSKITITDLDEDGDPEEKETGFSVNEFYTAKDYPVKVTVLDLKSNRYKPKNKFSVSGSSSIDELTISQGYAIELNDMHGKPRGITQFNQSGSKISSVVYKYNDEKVGDTERRLVNKVNIVKSNGSVEPDKVIGREIEFFTDFREQESINNGQSINLGVDLIPGIFAFPLPLPHFPKNENNDYRLFRSVSAVKVIQNYGIIDTVIKEENGSSISTANVAYDELTGEPLVTKTQNEFNQDIFSVNLPAYWVYKGMGGSYQNLGIILSSLATNSEGIINSTYSAYLNSGDELVNLSSGVKYWVVENFNGAGARTNRLIDSEGRTFTGTILLSKIIRSGLRNLLSASTSNIVCLNNPIVNGHFQFISPENLSDLKVLNASLTLYDDQWATTNVKQASEPIENTSTVFGFTKADSHQAFGTEGTVVYNVETGASTPLQSAYLSNGLRRSGIWLNTSIPESVNEWIGFEHPVTVTQGQMYYLGYSGDNVMNISIDNLSLPISVSPFYKWHLYPIYLNPGSHIIKIEALNYDSGPANTLEENPAAIGVELYKNSLAELSAAGTNGTGLIIEFSTLSLQNSVDLQSFRTTNGSRVYRFTSNNYVNPFLSGFLGNWLPYENKVFQENRFNHSAFDTGKKGMNIKDAGYIANFYSYWYYSTLAGSQPAWIRNALNGSRWISSKKATLYDRYSHELENVDALGRYSSAKFDFLGELPGAVASNAMNREIYANSFEDSKFRLESVNNTDTSGIKEFTQLSNNKKINSLTNPYQSHSGKYSVLLPAEGLVLSTIRHSKVHKNEAYLSRTPNNEYTAKSDKGLYPGGFEPQPLKKYIFNTWVKDGQSTNTSVNITLKLNSSVVPLRCKAIVEGWKLIEGIIDLNTIGPSPAAFNISLTPNSPAIYIDDIRIHPFDAHMKTYAYDENTMKLMAELDENGFATFYEYDDEGSLIRVKKETERGIMTIKETRSSYTRKSL